MANPYRRFGIPDGEFAEFRRKPPIAVATPRVARAGHAPTGAVAWPSSDLAAFVNGEDVKVDGGTLGGFT